MSLIGFRVRAISEMHWGGPVCLSWPFCTIHTGHLSCCIDVWSADIWCNDNSELRTAGMMEPLDTDALIRTADYSQLFFFTKICWVQIQMTSHIYFLGHLTKEQNPFLRFAFISFYRLNNFRYVFVWLTYLLSINSYIYCCRCPVKGLVAPTYL